MAAYVAHYVLLEFTPVEHCATQGLQGLHVHAKNGYILLVERCEGSQKGQDSKPHNDQLL